ncbi:meiosis protein SPO22/ZIP4 like-domain-containing protein [Gymnopilus junonius]|uniref:Meiosis protein SPO22/ZIP4 like-domain-containing protein n=1 Tax=Gymnopilus junonius TaxID=109634 RepID=A0A9P5NCT4_GYMJU|nr:meiosis protein SPO22/ZIP4 like-domain-containing protein [Gymnopilus junonius]
MSSSKKKTGSTRLQELHSSILEHLSTVKPLLDDPKNSQWPSVAEKLTQIASLAESFTEQRPKSSRSTWSHLADSLDQEGVSLWNISGLINKASEKEGQQHVASLRLAAFRLVEAGLETNPGVETLIHVLQIANKTAMGLSEIGNNVHAVSVLTSAAKIEEQLQNAKDSDDSNRRAIACVTVMYHSSRMEAAWKEGNDSLAQYMSRKIMADDNQHLSLLPPHARELLAYKFHQIGRSFLTSVRDESKATGAIQWLQWAFSIVDQLEESAAPGISGLKVSILRTMARAYFLSEAYDRAESVLDELIPTLDSSQDHATSEYQELRWLRLAVLKRRKAGDAALLDAFKSIVDHMEISEGTITEILQDLRAWNQHHSLVTAVHQHCLEQALQRHTTPSEHVHRLLLCLIIHASKDEDHVQAMKTLDDAFKAVYDAEVTLPSLVCTACLTLIWQYGGRRYNSKKWLEAAQWYTAGSHGVFKASGPSTSAKCFRKAALCHIEQREYALASTIIRRCSTNEAATHYIIFLTAIHQGLENEAIRAIQDMLKAPDFDRKMLLLATQISHQSEMKGVLLAVLESLLRTLKIGSNGEIVVEAMTLMRCIVKLILNLFAETAANKPVLIETVVNQFRTARILTQSASSQKLVPLVYKDISWLWRTAYNCAVQGCTDWENAGEQISELFDIAKEMLECCCHASSVDSDADLGVHLANATFAAVSGRVFSARELMTTTGAIDEENLRVIAAEIKNAKVKINDIWSKKIIQEAHDNECIQYFVHALRVFQAEFATHLKDWDQVSLEIDVQSVHDLAKLNTTNATELQEITLSGPLAVGTYDAIADILWLDSACPVHVLYKCLEAILRASLDHSSLSVEKFSRWLRAICTISLARDSSADRLKAIGYVEHAVRVIEDHHDTDEAYPMDERQWLLATAYNTGTECLHISSLDEAKRWFEAATVICRFVPGGKQRAEKISETYTRLLSRYEPKA